MAKDNSRSKKSRIKELFKNCIVGEAPAPQEGELQSTVPGGLLLRHPVCGTSCLPASLGFRTLVRRLRARTRAHTLTHSRAHTRTLSLPSPRRLLELEEDRPPTGQKASPSGCIDSRTSGPAETKRKRKDGNIGGGAPRAAPHLRLALRPLMTRAPHAGGAQPCSQRRAQEAGQGHVPVGPPPRAPAG